VVDSLSHSQGLLGAYATAWIGTGLTAIPPILLVLLLAHRSRPAPAAATA